MTEDKVHIRAYVQALVLLAIIIGISKTSGGMGKMTLEKETILNIHEEYFI